MSEKHLTNQRFSEFTLEPALQQGLRDAAFTFCTPIQAACLPAALEGRDVAGQAQTGTGKTVAFLLACCHYLLTHPAPPNRRPTQPRALILAPTRELAIQIHRDAQVLAGHTGFTLGLVYGGTGYDEQRAMLGRGVDILIGTPGRLIDFFRQGLYDLSCAQVAVLDEADRMFDLGFIRDIRFLLRRMPAAEKRLNLLFSATLSFKVMELAYEHMNDPQEIKIETDTVVVDQVTEYSFYPAQDEKLRLLVNLLKRDPLQRIMVFVNTRHAVERVADVLSANGIKCGALSGDVPQVKRERLLEAFKAGERKVLVATDVAARGLHIPAVSHVYNFDLPQDADDYIHRIGRTARAGASGEAISFVCEKYAYSIMDIESTIGHSLPRRDIDAKLLARIEMPRMRVRDDSTRRGMRGAPERGRHAQSRPATAPSPSPSPSPSATRPSPSPTRPAPSATRPSPSSMRPSPSPTRPAPPASAASAVSAGADAEFSRPPAPMAPQFAAPQANHRQPDAPTVNPPLTNQRRPRSTASPQPTPSTSLSPARAANPTPPSPATSPSPTTRFSRRYGEVPAVG